MKRESMDVDVVIVGAGPAGLAAACRLMQLATEHAHTLNVVVLEKGAEVGAHILSGAVMDPRALVELFPDWNTRGAPLNTPVTTDDVYFLPSPERHVHIPTALTPPAMHNIGNYVVSLGNVCRWLAEQAESLGADIFPGFAATEVLYNEQGAVCGIATSDRGVDRNGTPRDTYTPGMELHAKYTIFAEGCRGHLGKTVMEKFSLQKQAGTQHYGLGIKELWDIDPSLHQPGKVMHTMGWPLSESGSTGGGFVYHLENHQVAVGLITDLSYHNPHLSPFDEMQRLKLHPFLKPLFAHKAKRVSYGARAINKGGLQAVPKLVIPGGVLAGCEAGFMNYAKIKGSHTAMKTGMLAAESIFDALQNGDTGQHTLDSYQTNYQNSWVYKELHQSRNVAPAVHKFGMLLGSAYTFLDQNVLRGKAPWTLQDPLPDHATLKPASLSPHIKYPKPDGVITFSKLDSVFLSNTNHEENQPCHLVLSDPEAPIRDNWPEYQEPAQRYCPAGVYEVVDSEDKQGKRFQINAQNCVHCKTCDIKDPSQNITWVAPEEGGPRYPNM
ncbi:MAG: electron transfer flavoprotein-ubiquinone oxidoreductase [Gammaproteobacteria bacterium]